MKPQILFLSFLLLSVTSFCQQKTKNEKEDEGAKYEAMEHASERYKYAQVQSSWYKESLKKKPNIDKAEKAFNKYFSTHPDEETTVKNRFEIWMNQARLYKDKEGRSIAFPTDKRAKSLTGKAGLTSTPTGSFGTWQMIGPADMVQTQCNNSNLVMGGYCDRVYVNPYNTQNLFAGFSYGGLWVSTNQGNSWQLTDGSFANGSNTYANRDYYYGEIEASKPDNHLVFAATEAGLLKSINDGVNWVLCPTINRDASPQNRPYYIALSTNNPDIVLTTFGQKVYRSEDQGHSWSLVFDNSKGGANHRFTSQYTRNTPFGLNERIYNFFGLEADFSNPDHFYLGTWNSNNQACIYESNDKGKTFQLLVNLNKTLNTSWGKNTTLCLKTIPSSPHKFFVYEQFAKEGHLYYKLSSAGKLLSTSPINEYPEAFDIDWDNENILYQGEYGVYNATSGFKKSIDEGKTFTSPFDTTCNYIHPDIRGVSAVGNIVLIADDGGINLSTDGAKSVRGTGFNINSMDIWGFASSPKSDICLAGLDHNQTFVRSFAGAGGWAHIKGADAGACSINPYNDHWLYYDWGYGVNKGYLNSDGKVKEYKVSRLPDMGTLQFNPYKTFNIFGVKKSNNNILVHSTDNLTTATEFKDFGEKISSFRIAREDSGTMYVLLKNTTIKKTTDGGATWIDVTPSSAISNAETNITSIDVGEAPGQLWAAYGNAQNKTKVLYTNDGGRTWKNITTPTLPAVAVQDIAYQRGTDGGVYIITITSNATILWYRNNKMPDWKQVGSNLPLMGYIKGRLYVVPDKNKIRFGSSRGAWENNLYEKSSTLAAMTIDKNHLLPGDSVQFSDNSVYAPGAVKYLWKFPGGYPSSSTLANPEVRYAAKGNYNVKLTVISTSGKNTVTMHHFVTVDPDKSSN